MRRYLPLLLFIGLAWGQNKVNINNLVQYGDKMFKENDDKPYTGRVFDLSKATGNKILEGLYKDGKKSGRWTYYTTQGDGKYNITYKNGTFVSGEFIDDLGEKYKGRFILDEDDIVSFEERDGNYLAQDLQEYNFFTFPQHFYSVKSDSINGLYIGWHENGIKKKEGQWANNKKTGLWKGWYEDGKIKEEVQWVNGKDISTLNYEYYDNGQKRSEGLMIDGKENGLWIYWHDNGQKGIEGNYKNGKHDGLRKGWYENGQKYFEGNWKDGILEGKSIIWYSNGVKNVEVSYIDGKEEGLEIQWYENGQKMIEKYYKDGDKIYSKEWNPDGSVKE